MGRRRCRPRTCTPQSWRPCRAGSGRRRGALGPASSCRCAQCSTGSLPGSGCSRPLLGRTIQFDSDVRGGQDLLSYGGHHLVGPSVVRKAHCYLQRRGRLRDSEFVGQQTVHLRDGVVAEQPLPCPGRRPSGTPPAQVIWLVVNTSWSGPVR